MEIKEIDPTLVLGHAAKNWWLTRGSPQAPHDGLWALMFIAGFAKTNYIQEAFRLKSLTNCFNYILFFFSM
jgi:hypothetical protein